MALTTTNRFLFLSCLSKSRMSLLQIEDHLQLSADNHRQLEPVILHPQAEALHPSLIRLLKTDHQISPGTPKHCLQSASTMGISPLSSSPS
jgi:hypothetical protein